MHQPSYLLLEPKGEYFFFPWVFTHGIREYYDMGRIILDAPEDVRVSFNFTPILWFQIKKYLENVEDKWLSIYKKDPSHMEEEEKIFILRNFFSCNYERQIFPHPRFKYLLSKRGSIFDLEKKVRYFSNSELRDIMFYFIFTNVSEIKKEEDKVLKELYEKKENYSEEDKLELLKICFGILKDVVEIYKKLIKEKKIELLTTPFSHPILPLIIKSSSFLESSPHLRDKYVEFSYPQDIELQLDMAIKFMKEEFGVEIKGIWPSEGGISEETLNIFIKKDIKFTFTDEGILEKSLNLYLRGRDVVREELYRPYVYEGKEGNIMVFFRDRELSDRIGFVYKNLSAEDAVRDFVSYLENLRKLGSNLWVSIILDGENPWVYYENGGIEFLKKFYEVLSKKDFVRFSFFEEALSFEKKGTLRRIHPGSWIRSEFTTWMGDEEKNEGWIFLKKVREELGEKIFKNERALLSFLFAEGSDFFWWFGYDNPTFYAPEFDILFREHLKNVYRNLNKEYPLFLEKPIKKITIKHLFKEPSGYVYPVIDGKITDFYEWANAGIINLEREDKKLLKFLYFGWDKEDNFCIRIDSERNFKELIENHTVILVIKTEEEEKIFKFNKGEKKDIEYKFDKIFEFKIKIKGEKIYMLLLVEDDKPLRYPEYGFYLIEKIKKEEGIIL